MPEHELEEEERQPQLYVHFCPECLAKDGMEADRKDFGAYFTTTDPGQTRCNRHDGRPVPPHPRLPSLPTIEEALKRLRGEGCAGLWVGLYFDGAGLEVLASGEAYRVVRGEAYLLLEERGLKGSLIFRYVEGTEPAPCPFPW